MRIRGAMAIVAVLGLVALPEACDGGGGGGGGKYGDPIEANSTHKQAATSSVESVRDMRTLAQDNAGDDAAVAKVTGIWGNLNVVVSAKQQAELGQLGGGLEVATGALDAGCYTQGADGSVTYNQCSYGGGTIDGSLAYSGDQMSIDLTITSTMGGSWTIVETGELTITDAMVQGTLDMSITTDFDEGAAAGYAIDYDVDAIYDVQLTDGCPTGGTLQVHAVTSIANMPAGVPGGMGETDTWVKAEFGPACGDVTLY